MIIVGMNYMLIIIEQYNVVYIKVRSRCYRIELWCHSGPTYIYKFVGASCNDGPYCVRGSRSASFK